jgi:uncharacterized membrane protein YhhN
VDAAVIAATIACALACAGLVLAERIHHARGRVMYKLVASSAFVAVALLAGAPNSVAMTGDGGLSAIPGDYATWILAGLAFGAIGDACLLGSSDRAFLAGLVAFLAGHVAYVVAAAQLVPPSAWLDRAGVYAGAPIVAGAIALAWMWRRLGAMRVPVIVYVATIVAMTIGALAARDNTRLAIGASLFFASDLAVARDKFIARDFANKAIGLPVYYAAQLFLAWSLVS